MLSAERHPGERYGERPPSYTPSTAPPYSRPPASFPPPSSSSSAPRPPPEASTASIATHSTFSRGAGLPRIPDPFPRHRGPDLGQFRVGTWSSLHSNPNARHYQAVANRRVSAAASNNSSVDALRGMLDRLNEDEEQRAAARVRPLEDPHLVGEDAATRARTQRLARENGDEILIREDRQWDWWLGKLTATDPSSPLRSSKKDGGRWRRASLTCVASPNARLGATVRELEGLSAKKQESFEVAAAGALLRAPSWLVARSIWEQLQGYI